MKPAQGERPSGMPIGTTAAALAGDQRVLFLIAGAFNTAFAFVVFALLEVTIGHATGYLTVLLVAHVLGVLEAFCVYRWMVFKVRGNVLQDLVRFESVYLVALAVNAALLPLCVELVRMPVLLAQATIVVVTSLISFFGHRSFSFRRAA